MDQTQILVGLFGGLIGGISVAVTQHLLDKKKEIDLILNKIMEDKYRSLLVFMACAMDIKKRKYFTLNEQVPNKSSKDYFNQIREYYYHSVLYSPDEVILALKDFIKKPNMKNYIKTATEMRKDLWNKKTNLDSSDIILK